MMLGKSKLLILTLLTLLSTATFAAVNTSYHATVCGSGNYLFGCSPLTSSTTDSKTLGDSTVTLHLLVAPEKATSYTVSIEPGQIYLFGCQTYDANTTETNTLKQKNCECDSTVTLHLSVVAPPAPINVEYSASIVQGEAYLFGCDTFMTAGDYVNVLKRTNGADSTITLHLTVTPAAQPIDVAYSASIVQGEAYLFGCDTFMTAGDYVNVLKRTNGADSTITLHLTVTPAAQPIDVAYSASIVQGEAYLFGCDTFMTAGDYVNVLKRTNGADSTITLHLTVTPAAQPINVSYKDTIMVDEYYLFGCTPYTFSESGPQVLTNTLKRTNGADSIITCNLTVAGAGGVVMVSYSATIEAGEAYLFGCDTFMTTGTYTNTIPRVGALGDSTITLYLTVNQAPVDVTSSYSATIKQGEAYLFGCDTFMTAGTYTNTIPRIGALGDSTITLKLNVLATTYCDTTITTCDSLVWIHETIKTSGDYIDTIPNIAGGDSIVTLHLTVNYSTTGSETVTECDVYNWNGKNYTTSGTYVDTLTSLVTGCDSIVTLHLTINHSDVGEETITACDSIEWKGQKYYTSGDYQFDTLTVLGCDSTIILHLTVNYSGVGEETITACDSVLWKGQKYTASGDYTFDTLTVAGCDSIITLHLTINHSDVGEETATACDSYTWKGQQYTASGDYTFDTLTVAGCDSVITLHLTILQSTVGDTTAVECDKFVWYEHTCTASGDYVHTFIGGNAVGCDSVVTLHLTINNSVTKTVNVGKKCNMYYWAEADTTIIDGGINSYTHVFQTYQNCDSIVTLTVEIDVPYETTLDIKGYYGDRIIMINRNQINAIPGWHLDSLDTEHPELVEWYRIEASGDTTFLGTGYYYTLPSGDPLPAGVYFAEINLPAIGESCGAIGKTILYTITASAGAPALMPSYAQPGEDIRVVNLDPMEETIIRVYTAEGALQATYKAHGETTYPIKAAFEQGFYIVELSNSSMKSTLRYIVK